MSLEKTLSHPGIPKLLQIRRILAWVTIVVLAGCAEPQDTRRELVIGTGMVGGNYHGVGHGFARLFRDYPLDAQTDIAYETSAGSVANINGLASGAFQFALAQADHQHAAVTGSGPWSSEGPQNDLRSVFSLYDEHVTLVAGADTEIQSIADLPGKVLDIGEEDSGTHQNAVDALNAGGGDWRSAISIQTNPLDERLARFMARDIDAFFFTSSHPSTELKFAFLSERGARLVPLGDVAPIVAASPFYTASAIPAGLYPRSGAVATPTFSVKASLLTSADVAEPVVYAFVKTVFEQLEQVKARDVQLHALEEARFLEGLTAPLHGGALRYYDEVGLDVPDRLRTTP